jgi:hypothetical protein
MNTPNKRLSAAKLPPPTPEDVLAASSLLMMSPSPFEETRASVDDPMMTAMTSEEPTPAASSRPSLPAATQSSSRLSTGAGKPKKRKKVREGPLPTSGVRRSSELWTPGEDELLKASVALHENRNWKSIAEQLPDKTAIQCLHRWRKVLDPEVIKGPWTQQEDDKIRELVGRDGPQKWSAIAKELPGRMGKQCRERWHNHLDPNIKKGPWTVEEVTLTAEPPHIACHVRSCRVLRRAVVSDCRRARRRTKSSRRTTNSATSGPRSPSCCRGAPTTR